MDKDFYIVGTGANMQLIPVGALAPDQLTSIGNLEGALGKMGVLGKWLADYSKKGYTYDQNDSNQYRNYNGLARIVAANYGEVSPGATVKNGLVLGAPFGGSPNFSNLRATSDGKVILDFVYGNDSKNGQKHTGYIYSDDNGQTWNVVTNFENPFAEGGDFYKWKERDLSTDPDSEWTYSKANQVIVYPTNKFRFNNALGSAPYFELEKPMANRKKGYTSNQLVDKFNTYFNEGTIAKDASGYRPAAHFASKIYTTTPTVKRYGGRLDHSNFYKRGGRLNYFSIYGRKN